MSYISSYTGAQIDSGIAAAGTAVQPTRKVNGHALSADVTVTASDVGLGNVTNDAQTKAEVVPNTAPASGKILVGNAGGTAYAPVSVSGDATLASTGALSVSSGNGCYMGGGVLDNIAAGTTKTVTITPTYADLCSMIFNIGAYQAGTSSDAGLTLSITGYLYNSNYYTVKELNRYADSGITISAVTQNSTTITFTVTASAAGRVLLGYSWTNCRTATVALS